MELREVEEDDGKDNDFETNTQTHSCRWFHERRE